MQYETLIKPRRLFLQWHITERCNWHCRHCYQEEKSIRDELNSKQMFNVFKQYISLLKLWNMEQASISFTGGEPLIRNDLIPFLRKIKRYHNNLVFRILSNGSLLSKPIIRKLKLLGIQNFQVSLEGMKENNDNIRGDGAFEKTVKAIKLLDANKVKTAVSFTLTKQNVKDIHPLVNLCEELGVSALGIRRLVPCGIGMQLRKQLLEPFELREQYLNIEKIKRMLKRKKIKLKILNGCEQGLIALEKKCKMDNFCCVVEGRSIAILPNGDVLACRRLPIKLGNVLEKSLSDIYYNSAIFWNLKDLSNIHRKCKKCDVFYLCLGGAKCVTYSYFNELPKPDPQCWRCFNELPEVK